jgi:plasmid stabilization system protein ParE
MKVAFTPEAAQQADDCDAWWREHRPSGPGLFARELAEAQAIIVSMPGIGPVYTILDGRAVRRFLLRRSRNHVYYVVESDCVIIHSIWGAPKGRGPNL